MATYGFCENKCKQETYNKEEIDLEHRELNRKISEEADKLALQIALIPKIQMGTYSTSIKTDTTGYVDAEIVFDTPYKTAPTIVVGKNHTTDAMWATDYAVSAINITTTGFTLRITKSAEGHIYPVCSWIAVE